MRKFLVSFLLSATVATVFAQQPIIICAGGGISNTSSSAKDNGYLGNGYNAGADVFFPLYRKGWDGSVKGSGLTLGIIVSGDYSGVKNLLPDNAVTANRYQVFGGNTVVASQQEAKSSGSFSGMAGVQGIFSFGKLNVAPSLNAGYLQLKQKGFVQNGSAEINGQTYEAALVKSEAQSTSGFVFMPQVKIGYSITPGFSLFVSPSVLMGPEVKHSTQHLVPQGGFNDRNTYEIKQLASGTWEDGNTTTSKLNLTRINFGVSFSLGRRSKSTMPSRLSMTPTMPRQTQGKTFGEKVASGMQSGGMAKPGAVSSSYAAGRPGGPIGGIIVKGGKNPGGQMMTLTTNDNGEFSFDAAEPGNYKFEVSAPTQAGKGIQENGVKRAEAQDFNTTRSNRERGQFAARPGSPIGGIVVKGGKNPGGNLMTTATNEKGEIELNGLESGMYKFSLTMPDEPLGKSINEKGVKRAEAQDFNTTRNNRERGQFAARPGSPIGGIVVKGGKNPGGNLMTATTNEKGEVELNGLEKGRYKFTLTTPDEPQGKSINEKGVKRAEAVDHNTTRNNRERGQLAANPGSGSTQTSTPQKIEAQDFNTTRSNREGSGTHQLKAQNNNTVRSNRSDNALKASEDSSHSNLIPAISNISSRISSNADNTTADSSYQLKAQNNNTIRSGREESEKRKTKAQNNNTAGSNKSASIADHNSSRSNKSASVSDHNSSRSNKDRRQLAARPGSPIGGIVVKGGKNPGGNMTNLNVGDDGTIEFEILEACNYKMIITTPDAPQGKSINEKGVKRQ